MPSAEQRKSLSPSKLFSLLFLIAAVVAVLFLPPISLADRLFHINYEPVGPESRTFQTDDGAQITFLPSEANQSAWVKVESVPDTSLLPSDSPLLTAINNIPMDRTVESPLYYIQYSGDPPKSVILTIPMAKGEESGDRRDLYAWDGKSWQWLPSHQSKMKQVVEAEANFLPENVAIMQSQPSSSDLAVDYDQHTLLPDNIADTLVEINPQGFYLKSGGQISDNAIQIPSEIQSAEIAVIPTLKNQNEVGVIDAALVNPLLSDSEMGKRHIKSIVDLVENGEYQGVDLDYRGIHPDLQEEYIAFLAALRQSLPENKQLSVRVELPQQLSTGAWDTGAYDWQAIGRLANVVKLPALPNPDAYRPAGRMEDMLDWAVSQINRDKIQIIYRANSTAWVDGKLQDIDDQKIFEQLGEVITLNNFEVINPDQQIDFTLSGQQATTGIHIDEASGTYWFGFLDNDNRHHTIYLANPATLVDILNLASRHNLQGVVIQNANTNDQLWQIVQNYSNGNSIPASADSEYSVAWRVQTEDGQVVTEETVDLQSPNYQWTAPEEGGVFEVAAGISSSQNPTPISQGQIAVLVATPTPTPSPTFTATPIPSPTATSTPTATPTATPQPTATAKPVQAIAAPPVAAPQPPALPPVNIPFGYGIQADPRGNTAWNIEHIKEMGFNWVKFQMAWKDVESAPGDFSWAMWDQLIDAYAANGIQVLLSIPKSPDWARPPDDDKSVEGPPQDPNQYAAFVGNVAGRYRGRVQAIEVWNEQNLWYEAGGLGRINAANYVQLLQLSYRTIKDANPDMIVVSGALTPAGNVGEAAVDDIIYLQQMYDNGAKGFFDALGAHPSGYNCPAKADWRTVSDSTAMSFRGTFENRHHSWCFRGTMEGYREVMLANGDNKAIIPTEFGWAVSGNPKPGYEYARDNTPEEQAQWIVEAYEMGKEWGWSGPMFLWNLDYGVTAPNTELAGFGILNTPAYNAMVTMPK